MYCLNAKSSKRNALWYILDNLFGINALHFFRDFWEISEELDLEYIHTDDLKKWQTPCMAH